MSGKRWTVIVDIGEENGAIKAVARLHTRDDDRLLGVGTVQLDADERRIPHVGDELAVARALSALSARLTRAAADDLANQAEPAANHG